MKAVGQLTGGSAHDFNDLLQIILGNLDTRPALRYRQNWPRAAGAMGKAATAKWAREMIGCSGARYYYLIGLIATVVAFRGITLPTAK